MKARLRRLLAIPPPHPARFIEEVGDSVAHNDHGALRRFLARVERERLLDIGSGDRRLRPDATTLDIEAYPQVDIVADAHNLPLEDCSFGAVVLQTVIEHVLEPERVLAEAVRVLRPGGLIYVEAPFLYPVHGEADYYRWTLAGLRYVVGKQVEVLESGQTMGPGAALSLNWDGFVEVGLRRWHWALRNLVGWATSWLRLLEPAPGQNLGRSYAVTYVVGRKSTPGEQRAHSPRRKQKTPASREEDWRPEEEGKRRGG